MSDIFSLPKVTGGVVRVLGGPDQGKTYVIGAEGCTIGTSDECDLVLHDAKVSRRHVSVSLAPRGFLVRDLGSRNGTYLDNTKISEVAMAPGAIVRLGSTQLLLTTQSVAAVECPPSDARSFGELVGGSLAIRRVYALLETASASDVTVLLRGETGTGKDVAARSLHAVSSRREGPFSVLDCRDVLAPFFASLLFGDAEASPNSDRYCGLVERASGGTLYLDEVSAIPMDVQAALLRLFDDKTVARVGSVDRTHVDLRIVVSTTKDLETEVREGRFLDKLYYRLNVLPIRLPPLRERKDDIRILVRSILGRLGTPEPGSIDGDGLARLMEHQWPGNVRELANVLERARSAALSAPFVDLPLDFEVVHTASCLDETFKTQKQRVISQFERSYLQDLLGAHDGNIRRASRASGIERTQLKRLLTKHSLR